MKVITLTLLEAKHLVKIENTKGDMLELIAILEERKQITPEMEEELQDWVETLF